MKHVYHRSCRLFLHQAHREHMCGVCLWGWVGFAIASSTVMIVWEGPSLLNWIRCGGGIKWKGKFTVPLGDGGPIFLSKMAD